MEDKYDHQNPENWKLHFLYYNKKDARIFPPKRWGLGWTINFANPYSILLLFGVVAINCAIFYFVSK